MPGGKELARICMGDDLLTEEELFDTSCYVKLDSDQNSPGEDFDLEEIAESMRERHKKPSAERLKLRDQWHACLKKGRTKETEK